MVIVCEAAETIGLTEVIAAGQLSAMPLATNE
jgi:hypothetical protein